LLGSIAQIEEPLFFRRQNRPVENTKEMAHRQVSLFVKSNFKGLAPWVMFSYEFVKIIRESNLSDNEKEILCTDIKNCFPHKFGSLMHDEVSDLIKKVNRFSWTLTCHHRLIIVTARNLTKLLK